MKLGVGRRVLAARDALLGRAREEPWGKDVFAVAVGAKVVEGIPGGDTAVQLVLRKKLPLSKLSRSRRIPKSIDGLPTDVLRATGELASTPVFLPSLVQAGASGTPFISSAGNGKPGTIGCIAATPAEARVALTAAHVAPSGSGVALPTMPPPRPIIGRAALSYAALTGRQLYGDWAADPDELFLTDIAVIEPQNGFALIGGLPAGRRFRLASTRNLVQRFRDAWQENTFVGAYSLGGASGGWRTGGVVGIWGRRPTVPGVIFCLIQQSLGPTPGGSKPGDSGSLWLAAGEDGLTAIGLHWGKLADNTAVVSDLHAASSFLGIAPLGSP